MAAPCELGHTQKAMECPACCHSTDPKWWKWYRSRTGSKRIKALIDARKNPGTRPLFGLGAEPKKWRRHP